jgi:hypothetical protein
MSSPSASPSPSLPHTPLPPVFSDPSCLRHRYGPSLCTCPAAAEPPSWLGPHGGLHWGPAQLVWPAGAGLVVGGWNGRPQPQRQHQHHWAVWGGAARVGGAFPGTGRRSGWELRAQTGAGACPPPPPVPAPPKLPPLRPRPRPHSMAYRAAHPHTLSFPLPPYPPCSNYNGNQTRLVVRSDWELDDADAFSDFFPGCEREWTCPPGHNCNYNSVAMVCVGVIDGWMRCTQGLWVRFPPSSLLEPLRPTRHLFTHVLCLGGTCAAPTLVTRPCD